MHCLPSPSDLLLCQARPLWSLGSHLHCLPAKDERLPECWARLDCVSFWADCLVGCNERVMKLKGEIPHNTKKTHQSHKHRQTRSMQVAGAIAFCPTTSTIQAAPGLRPSPRIKRVSKLARPQACLGEEGSVIARMSYGKWDIQNCTVYSLKLHW